MDIDFIKWKVGYADGFEMFNKDIIRFRYQHLNYDWIVTGFMSLNNWSYYPLLDQRAIEGVNREACKRDDDYTYINSQSDCINYSLGVNREWLIGNDGSTNIFFGPKMTEDEAKEAALKFKYVREQETLNVKSD